MNKSLENNEISIEQPLEWDVVNTSRRRIFRKGFIFHTKESLLQLDTMELYYVTQNHGLKDKTEQVKTSRTIQYQLDKNDDPHKYLISGQFKTSKHD